MNVRDLMTTDVVVAHPETSLKAVARLLLEHRISGVPVVDGEGRVLGVVSEADLLVKEAGQPPQARRSPLRWLLGDDRDDEAVRQRINAVTAGEAMTTPVATIEADRPLSEAARRMTEGAINRLPVVVDGRLAGIITRADVVRAYARSDDELLAAAQVAVRAIDGLRVEEVSDGVVRIAGSVSHASVAATARKVIVAIDGVVAVDDRDVSWPDEPEPVPPPGWTREGMGPRSA
jgi:CBS domain-containing protein